MKLVSPQCRITVLFSHESQGTFFFGIIGSNSDISASLWQTASVKRRRSLEDFTQSCHLMDGKSRLNFLERRALLISFSLYNICAKNITRTCEHYNEKQTQFLTQFKDVRSLNVFLLFRNSAFGERWWRWRRSFLESNIQGCLKNGGPYNEAVYPKR